MVLDPAGGAIQTNVTTGRQVSSAVPERADTKTGNRPEAGQASDSGPAVVANISAAALETARAVNGPSQATDQNSAGTVVKKAESGQSQALLEQDVTQKRQDIAKKRIDIMI